MSTGLDLNVQDLVAIISGLELAINRKAFSREEVMVFFPAWNNLVTTLDKFKREALLSQLYPETKPETKSEPTKESVEIQIPTLDLK